MFRHNETWFGVVIEPGPHEFKNNEPAMVQLMAGHKGDMENWARMGPKFPAAQLGDLLKAIQRAQKVLDADYTKAPEGYRTRNVFF